jgi:hypothetical protein
MKRVITLTIAAFISAASFGQAEKKDSAAPKTDTVWVDASKAKVVAFIDSVGSKQPFKLLPVEGLAKADLVGGDKEYWYNLFKYMKQSRNGNYSAEELERLMEPFAQYALQYAQILETGRQRQPRKQ